MADPAAVAKRQNVESPSPIARLVTLPFRFFGALCGSLLLSVLIEWIGMHFFWPRESWHHAERMLQYELREISTNFSQSLVLSRPAQTAHHLTSLLSNKLFHEPKLQVWAKRATAHPFSNPPHAEVIQNAALEAYSHVKPYALAAGYTLLTFFTRLLVLTLTLPLFLLASLVGFIDGLVRRDIRRFEAGYESGFLYHRARAAILPAAILPWVIYLALPVSVPPLLILLPGAALLAFVINITAASFKKYL